MEGPDEILRISCTQNYNQINWVSDEKIKSTTYVIHLLGLISFCISNQLTHSYTLSLSLQLLSGLGITNKPLYQATNRLV